MLAFFGVGVDEIYGPGVAVSDRVLRASGSEKQNGERISAQFGIAIQDAVVSRSEHDRAQQWPLQTTPGQGADLLETRVWDALSDRVASYSASRSFRTAAI